MRGAGSARVRTFTAAAADCRRGPRLSRGGTAQGPGRRPEERARRERNSCRAWRLRTEHASQDLLRSACLRTLRAAVNLRQGFFRLRGGAAQGPGQRLDKRKKTEPRWRGGGARRKLPGGGPTRKSQRPGSADAATAPLRPPRKYAKVGADPVSPLPPAAQRPPVRHGARSVRRRTRVKARWAAGCSASFTTAASKGHRSHPAFEKLLGPRIVVGPNAPEGVEAGPFKQRWRLQIELKPSDRAAGTRRKRKQKREKEKKGSAVSPSGGRLLGGTAGNKRR